MLTTTLKYAIASPKKMTLVAKLVQGENTIDAIRMLQFTQKKSAKILQKAIKTAVNNAKQAGVDSDVLAVSSIVTGRAPSIKRMRAGSRGRGQPYTKGRSYIKIILSPIQ